MRPRAATALLSLACLVASAAADPLATFRPPRGASDRAASLVSPPQLSADEARASLGATTREAAAGGSPREEEANERDDVAPMASADALTDAGLSADVSAAVAFARSSLDAYENDRRYAAVVHEAVDALNDAFWRSQIRRSRPSAPRATPRFAWLWSSSGTSSTARCATARRRTRARVPSGRRYVTARDVLRRGRARPAPAGPAGRAPSAERFRLFPRGLFGFRDNDAFSSADDFFDDDAYYDDDDAYYYDDPYYLDDLDRTIGSFARTAWRTRTSGWSAGSCRRSRSYTPANTTRAPR